MNEADVKTRQIMNNSEAEVNVDNKQAQLDKVQETLSPVSQRKVLPPVRSSGKLSKLKIFLKMIFYYRMMILPCHNKKAEGEKM